MAPASDVSSSFFLWQGKPGSLGWSCLTVETGLAFTRLTCGAAP